MRRTACDGTTDNGVGYSMQVAGCSVLIATGGTSDTPVAVAYFALYGVAE